MRLAIEHEGGSPCCTPIIMAGGSGTRFWPKSRRDRPKQLLNLYGDATMLQQTVARISPLVPAERVVIVTGADQAAATREQLPELPPGNIVAEPCPRNTAPCVGLAAWIVQKRDPGGTMIVMPADHVIEPAETFLNTVRAAVAVIEDDPTTLITFGIKPTHPETGYGYIERGELLETREGVPVNRVDPVPREARPRDRRDSSSPPGTSPGTRASSSGRPGRSSTSSSGTSPGSRRPWHASAPVSARRPRPDVLAEEFPRMDRLPIDKAVMEKASNVRVLEVRYDWNDVGDWRALATLLPHDAQGNATQGDVIARDTTATRSSSPTTAA